MRAFVLLLLTLALSAPVAFAQDHQHASGEGMAWALFDGPEDGRAVVGGLTHFGFALAGKDGKPLEHRDASFEVVQDGVTVFSSPDTHEYDGLFSFDVVFTKPGPYRVVARSEALMDGVFEGVAVEPVYATVASVEAELKTSPASGLVEGTLRVVDGHGQILPHTDALVEVRRVPDLRLVSRFHAHIHEEPIVFRLALPPGDHLLTAHGYRAFPDGEDPDVGVVVGQFPVSVGAAPTPSAPLAPMVPMPLSPLGGSAEKDGYALHATYDPYNEVGVGTPFRLAALVMGPDGRPLPHVDFSFAVNGPSGEVFRSDSLHEYDGTFEWVYVPALPGLYQAVLTADARGVELRVPYQVEVLPPALPLGAGPNVLTIEGLDAVQAGVPANLTFRIAGPSGALSHSEIDVSLVRPGGGLVQQFKLHTHASGEFRALVQFPEEGDWLLHVDAFPLLPQAAFVVGPGGPGSPLLYPVSVAAPPVADVTTDAAEPPQRLVIPDGGALLALAALGAALLARRR